MFYNELDLELLQNRGWYRKLFFYTKLLLTNPLPIFLTRPPETIELGQLEGQITFLCLALNAIFCKTATFHQLLRNEIDLT